MDEQELQVRLDVTGAETARSLERVIGAQDGLALQDEGASDAPALVVYELGPEPDRAMGSVRTLIGQATAGCEVFLLTESLDPNLLLQAMRMGIKEVLATPLDEEEVRAAFQRYQMRRGALDSAGTDRTGKILYVIGSKGGVGTTTVAVNLAVGLCDGGNGVSVAVVDMNMLFGEIPLFLGIRPRHHWGEIARNVQRMDQDYLRSSLYRHGSGVQVLAAPRDVQSYEVPNEDVVAVFAMMKRMFDYVVIDGGQRLSPLATSLLEMAEQIFVVSGLNLPCLANTNRILETFYDIGCMDKDRVRIVMNRWIKNTEITVKDAEKSLKMPVFWALPNDYVTSVAAINRGEPLVRAAPGTELARSLRALSDRVAGRETPERRPALGFLRSLGLKKAKLAN